MSKEGYQCQPIIDAQAIDSVCKILGGLLEIAKDHEQTALAEAIRLARVEALRVQASLARPD